MKFSFGKKDQPSVKPVSKAASSPEIPAKGKAVTSALPKSTAVDGRRLIIVGLIFISLSFLGAVFLLYLSVNEHSAKDLQLRDMKQELVLVKTEKELIDNRAQEVAGQVGRVIDVDKVLEVSEKIHGAGEADRKEGSLWINRKTKACMVTLGGLNGVEKGSRLGVYDAGEKFATVKIVSALDVISYAEPVDIELKDFTKDYYAVKIE